MKYRGHILANTLVLNGSTVAMLSSNLVPATSICAYMTAFTVATFWLSPDLDLSHSQVTKNWGFFKGLWRPYSLICKHRGMSHNLFFSTLTKITYILLCVGSIFFIMTLCKESKDFILNLEYKFLEYIKKIEENIELITAIMGGWIVSDISHIILDRVSSALKRWVFRLFC